MFSLLLCMQILQDSAREGSIRVKIESLDDLWELSHLIKEGDDVEKRTTRKVAVGGDQTKQVRKPMTLSISVSSVSLEQDILRILGTITQGPEDLISFGDHHSFACQPGDDIKITKEWDAISRQKLQKAAQATPLNILVCVFDREEAVIAELTRRGSQTIQTLKGDVAKKAPGGGEENFWKTLAEAITQLERQNSYARIVIGSPAFWTDYLHKALPDSIQQKTAKASVSSVGEAGLKELLKRPELENVLKEDRNAQEEQLLAQVLEAIGAEKGCYGIDECEEKASLGQISHIVVSSQLIKKAREEDWFGRLDAALSTAKSTQAEVHLIEHDTKQLDAIGGVAGVLRW